MAVAIFVMEIGLDDRIPTYCGGMGILTGDLAMSYADLGIPATVVTLLSRNGYVRQTLSESEGQRDAPQPWDWRSLLAKTRAEAKVELWDRVATVGAWEYKIKGKAEVSVLFLDTDLPDNDQDVREATDRLYGGGQSIRLIQDIVLGVGGYRVLKALGREVRVYHLNESHAAFATVEFLRDFGGPAGTRKMCVFTTHTPVAAGNDAFPTGMVQDAFRRYPWMNWGEVSSDGVVSLSKLAWRYSGVTNAVSLKHRFVAGSLLGNDGIQYVTNGVYHKRWVHPELKKVYGRYMPGWEGSPSLLARATAIPSAELAAAHGAAKAALLDLVNRRSQEGFVQGALTITVAKRFTAYKRNSMILSDPTTLESIASQKGELQIIIAGKAHPMDGPAKGMLADTLRKAARFRGGSRKVKVAVLDNYDIETAKLLVAGSDVWLNNPRRPLEASGTSGMKAAMNGVLNLSTYDGWWLEGGVDGVNGWGIGRRTDWADLGASAEGEDEGALYAKLAGSVVPTYYGERERWLEMSKSSVAMAGPLFNSYRMAEDYVTKVYAGSL